MLLHSIGLGIQAANTIGPVLQSAVNDLHTLNNTEPTRTLSLTMPLLSLSEWGLKIRQY